MSGHSKWHSIKHKKGAIDAKRGKIFTKHAKLIQLAARHGGDPEMNPSLRLAIDNAKADNTPNLNIERSIKKGTGEDKDAAQLVEVVYEGYGPAGVALFIQCITDNKNRTVSSIRSTLTKNGGSLGEAGCVAWMFEPKGLITVISGSGDPDEMELTLIDAGASDLERDGEVFHVYTNASELAIVAKKIREANLVIDSQELTFVPKTTVKIEDKSTADKIMKLMDLLDEDDDITNVSANFDIDENMF